MRELGGTIVEAYCAAVRLDVFLSPGPNSILVELDRR